MGDQMTGRPVNLRVGDVYETVSGGCPDSALALLRHCPDGSRTVPDSGVGRLYAGRAQSHHRRFP